MMNLLKVSHKLALGFAAILVLTVAVALIGSFGMDALISRSDKAQDASMLLDEANRIRFAQVSFETRGDPQYVEMVEQAVARIVQLVQEQRADFIDPQDLQRLDAIASEATATFRRSSKNGAERFQWSCRMQMPQAGCF